ncbi:unnamed protein product [Ilex paraguariensis]|uniref:Protein WVD2-like 7 n=1 Tax=Ilex paraguariensis TaxID=185542 RepID=A0ABC8SFE6_9AQUA
MGESSPCLVRSVSQLSPTSDEFKEGDPLRALTTSISFGRFVSQSLAWEKWSSFTHNQYLEEVEKYSKPGSVAEKKAYFEAHYRRKAAKKASVLLEQGNVAANDSSEPNLTNEICDNSSMNPELVQADSHVRIEETEGENAHNVKLVLSVEAIGCNAEGNNIETAKAEGAESVTEQLCTVANTVQVELSNQIESVENHSTIVSMQENNTHVKDAANQGTLEMLREKKPEISSFKSSTCSGATKLRPPAKPTTLDNLRKADNATPNNRKTARVSLDKKSSTPKSLHTTINFASCASENQQNIFSYSSQEWKFKDH